MLSFPIAKDVFRSRAVLEEFADGERMFSGLREGTDGGDASLLYVFSTPEGAQIASGTDRLLLPGMDAHKAYCVLAERIERLADWERRLQSMIFADCTLKDIVDVSVPIFQNAIMITDESNRIQAMSDHGPGEVSPEWDYMLQNSSTELGLVLDIFRAEPFKAHVLTGDPTPFYFVPQGLSIGGINCRIPAPDHKGALGTALITTNLTPVSEGMLQTARIFADAVCRWVRLHHESMPMGSASGVFSETLEGQMLSENRSLLLYTAVLAENDAYRVLCVSNMSQLPCEVCFHSIETTVSNAVCCRSDGRLWILVSDAEHETQAKKIAAFIENVGARLGVSNRFSDLHRLSEYAEQARIAAAYGTGTVSTLSAECVMRYTAEHMQKTPMRQSLVHPDILALDAYDRAHGTEFYKTLYVYLTHERRIADALPVLNIHRNTMIYRLKRLESMMTADLNDPAEQEYLMLSFRMLYLPNSL